MSGRPTQRRADSGFTFIEALIVFSVMGIIVPSLAVAFMVIVRTTPDTEVRLDDARTTRGLATWLSHDTTSAPRFEPMNDQGGIDVSSTLNSCGGDGISILHLQWTEDGFSERTYVSDYRFVVAEGAGRIVRYTCSRAGTGSFSGTRATNLTSGLSPSAAPIITLLPEGRTSGDPVESVDVLLTALSGQQVLVETGSRNPSEFFPT